MSDLLNEIVFLFQRLNWLSVLDLFLVTAIFYGILLLIKDSQAMVLLRGVFLLVVLISLLIALVDLPAFSWLVNKSLPALLLAIPVVFAPEIRRGLERIGRASSGAVPLLGISMKETSQQTVKAVVTASARLSARKHGALIVFQRFENLIDYIKSGTPLNAIVTPELLLQVFYPNTPLHDGAVIIAGDVLVAASCVLPLSSSGILLKAATAKWVCVTGRDWVSRKQRRRGCGGVRGNRLDFGHAGRTDHPQGRTGPFGRHFKCHVSHGEKQGRGRLDQTPPPLAGAGKTGVKVMNWLKRFIKTIPLLLMAIVMALAVWIMAVTASDPMEEKLFPNPVSIEILGQDPSYMITSSLPSSETIMLNAPHSIWTRLTTYPDPVKAVVDLSGLEAGTHEVPVQLQISLKPVRIVSFEPDKVSITLEKIISKVLEITFQTKGEPAVGFRAETPTSDQMTATVSGAESLVSKIVKVKAVVDVTQAQETINRTVTLEAVDADGNPVTNVSITPSQVNATENITALGGYRNVVVKVVWTGQIAAGYRLTNISIFRLRSRSIRRIRSWC